MISKVIGTETRLTVRGDRYWNWCLDRRFIGKLRPDREELVVCLSFVPDLNRAFRRDLALRRHVYHGMHDN